MVLFQCCTNAIKKIPAITNTDSAYYTADDFISVNKIDAHMHIRTDADTLFINQAKQDNFRFITLNVYKEGGTSVEEQQEFAIKMTVSKHRVMPAFKKKFLV